MQGSKLLDQLKILEKEDFKGFFLFIRSTYFNQSKDVIRLFDYLRKYYPVFDSPKLDKKIVFKKLFSTQIYTDVKLRNLRTKASKLVEQYLIHLYFQQDDFQRKKLVTQIYGQRNYYPAFDRNTQQLLNSLEQQPYRDACYFHDKYLLQRDYYLYSQTLKEGNSLTSLQNAIDNLATFYKIEHLRLLLLIANRTQIYADTPSPNQKNNLNTTNNSAIILALYQQILLLFEADSEEHFFITKAFFLAHKDKLRKIEAQSLLIILINCAHRRVTIKEDVYTAEIFQLYKNGIDQNLLLENDLLNESLYLNIIIFGSALKKYDWLDQFIANYSTKITGNNKADILLLSSAFYHFNKADFSKAIQVISPHKFNNKILELPAKSLAIRACYEVFIQNESFYHYLESAINAFYKFLKRDHIFDQSKILPYLNFIKLLKKLIKFKVNKNLANAKPFLLQFLAEHKPISAAAWIKEKIETIC